MRLYDRLYRKGGKPALSLARWIAVARWAISHNGNSERAVAASEMVANSRRCLRTGKPKSRRYHSWAVTRTVAHSAQADWLDAGKPGILVGAALALRFLHQEQLAQNPKELH